MLKRASGALLFLPNGQLVFQRRTKDAPSGAGQLSFFGGAIEPGETMEQALVREVSEEIDIDLTKLSYSFLFEVKLDPSETAGYHFIGYLYRVDIKNLDFAIYEGDGAEAYTVAQALARNDLTPIARKALHKLLEMTQ